MFWNHNAVSSSQIDTLLTKQDVTLQQVMESDDIINDCRLQNKTLIDYLMKPEVITELVNLTTTEPSPDLEERVRYKYPNIACELLTCDVPSLNERLAGDKELLEKLYKFLGTEPPLNPLLASFFSKIMGALIAKKTEQNWLSYQFTCLQVLDYLKVKEDFLESLLKHLGTSAIMDLTLKLITQIEGVEMKQNALNWLDSQGIMQQLVSLLNPKIDKERHYNVAQLLCDFIRIARDTQRNSMERVDPDPLLNTLESPETLSLLIDNILSEEKCESAIVGGIQILLAILDVSQTRYWFSSSVPYMDKFISNRHEDSEHEAKLVSTVAEAVRRRLEDFHKLLLEPPKKMPIHSTVGVLDVPLGNTRLQVTKLFASLIATSNLEFLLDFMSLGTFSVLLDLFFQYQWNNFLHTQVKACIASALSAHLSEDVNIVSDALCKHLLVECKLINRILDAWRENDEQQKHSKVRQGYMGHLINLVNMLVELCSTTTLGQYLKTNLPEVAKDLDEFKDTVLKEANKKTETKLGGVSGTSINNFNDDSGNFNDILSPQNQALQMFPQYQMQHMTPHYSYSGFGDEGFNEDDGNRILIINPRNENAVDLSEGELGQQQELFKQVCAQNINSLDDVDDQIFEDKEHTLQTVIEKSGDGNEPNFSSSDSDSDGEDPLMDTDPWTSPKPGDNPLTIPDPWSNPELLNSDSDMGGWADFSAAAFDMVCSTKCDNPLKAEADLKVDSVNTTPGAVDKTDKVEQSDSSAQPIEVPMKEAEMACEPSKDDIAAGDQGGIPDVAERKDANVALEPSISATPKVGDSCAMDTGSKAASDIEKSDKDNV